MELNKAVLQIYPDADLLDTIRLQDDGGGAYIAEWNDPRPQPSEAELQAAWVTYEAGALDRAKAHARQFVRDYALVRIAELDSELQWGNVGTNLVMGEAERFLLDGRPANPAPAQYAIANKWRVRRGETLAETLNWMADKYLVMYSDTATIIDVWNGKITDIEAAATVEEVAAVLASLP